MYLFSHIPMQWRCFSLHSDSSNAVLDCRFIFLSIYVLDIEDKEVCWGPEQETIEIFCFNW